MLCQRIDLRVWWRWRLLSWWKACDGCGRRGHPKRSATFGGGRERPEQFCDFRCRSVHVDGEDGVPQYFETADGTLMVFVPNADEGVIDVHCHGADDHFRDPDGACVHTDQVLAVQSGKSAPIRVLGYRGAMRNP
jgi:hypothetical protein